MLECYTFLAALAQHTERIRLGALVTGNTYRNPTLLAKVVTALDVVSRGRAQLGIGAGWFKLDHDFLGHEFINSPAPVGRLARTCRASGTCPSASACSARPSHR